MKEQTLQREFNELMKNIPRSLGDIFFDLRDFNNQSGVLDITFNGWHGGMVFTFTYNDVEGMYKWLEDRLLFSDSTTHELTLGQEQGSGDSYVLGMKKLVGFPGTFHNYDWNDDLCIPMSECCILYTYNESQNKIGRRGLFRTEDAVRRMYSTIKNSDGLNLKSSVIESHFLEKEIHLEYKGYSTTTTISKHDLRYSGQIVAPDNTIVEVWGYAANNYLEVKTRFESLVEKIIEYEYVKKAHAEWHNSNIDTTSIGYVFDIMPDKFRERIQSGEFNRSLNSKVEGGLYEVPLYYVTKAWDVILKGDLCDLEFKVEYEPEYDDPVDRTLEEAIQQNDEMKKLWKEFFDIDINLLEVDFSKFNKNLHPNVSEDAEYYHFQDVPNGITEWILDGINSPTGNVSFDDVSSLMEFTAYILRERELYTTRI